MVYRLTSMNKKTKVIFFFLIWLFSAFCAVVGTLFIATAAILPNTPYDIHPSHHVLEIRQNLGPFETLAYFDPEIGEIFWGVSIVEGVEEFQLVDENNVKIGPLIPWNLIEVHRNGS
ncbi:MAG: hypothetical protein ACFFDI_32970, partial [Promethearchaeota archaeon]